MFLKDDTPDNSLDFNFSCDVSQKRRPLFFLVSRVQAERFFDLVAVPQEASQRQLNVQGSPWGWIQHLFLPSKPCPAWQQPPTDWQGEAFDVSAQGGRGGVPRAPLPSRCGAVSGGAAAAAPTPCDGSSHFKHGLMNRGSFDPWPRAASKLADRESE